MMAGTEGSGRQTGTQEAKATSGTRTPRGRKPPPPPRPSASARRRLTVGLLVFVVFAALVVAGLALDEFQSVLANAATICLSCIGIQ